VPVPATAPATPGAPALPEGLVVVRAAEPAPAPATTSAVPVLAEPLSPVPVAPSSGGTADAGTREQDRGTADVPVPTAATAAPAAAPAPAATVATAPAARADVPQQPVAAQVAPAVATLASGSDGTHTMTLVLTPETLGPVEVRVTVHDGRLDLSLRGASDAGRAALLDALPDLRRDLEASGLTCSKLSVDRDQAGSGQSQAQAGWQQAQQQAGGQGRGGAHGSADDRGRPWLRGADPDGGRPAAAPVHPASSGLDVRA
jgi:flagellar hook-length control protein FliK